MNTSNFIRSECDLWFVSISHSKQTNTNFHSIQTEFIIIKELKSHKQHSLLYI